MAPSLADVDLVEAASGLRDGAFSAVELTQAHLDRIAERDPRTHAFLHIAADAALADAADADLAFQRGEDRGPLHGIPVAVKDIFDTADMPTTYGSDFHHGHRPERDAEIVRRLRQAGAIVLGKLETYEFAMVGPVFDRSFPPAANPWSTGHFTGGSSSGCAAAVAGGLVRTTVGSDTGGSVRSPAAYCGVVGLKPTFGSLSMQGAHPLSPTLDHAGIVSASVPEAALTFDVLADLPRDGSGRRSARSKIGQPLDGLRIGYARQWFARDPETAPQVLDAIDTAASQLSLLGARIEEMSLPEADLFEAVGATIIHAEAFALHREKLAKAGFRYSRKVFQNIMSGLCLSEGDLEKARHAATMLRQVVDQTVFSHVDVILTAATLTPAIPFAEFEGDTARWTPMRTIAFNVTGHPALAVPCGLANSLPLGLQLVGRAGDEATLFQVAHAYEQASDFAALKPAFP